MGKTGALRVFVEPGYQVPSRVRRRVTRKLERDGFAGRGGVSTFDGYSFVVADSAKPLDDGYVEVEARAALPAVSR